MTLSVRFVFVAAVVTLLIGAEWALYVKARNAGRNEDDNQEQCNNVHSSILVSVHDSQLHFYLFGLQHE